MNYLLHHWGASSGKIRLTEMPGPHLSSQSGLRWFESPRSATDWIRERMQQDPTIYEGEVIGADGSLVSFIPASAIRRDGQ